MSKQTQLEALDTRIKTATTKLTELNTARTELLAAIEQEKISGQFLATVAAGLPAGTTIKARYGRGEKARVVDGRVNGFKPAADKVAAAYSVITGEGFDTTVVIVPAANIISYFKLGEGDELGTTVYAPGEEPTVAQ